MTDRDDDLKLIGILVAGRNVADFLAVGVLPQQLRAVLVDVQPAAGDGVKVQNIRVGLRQIPGAGDGEPTVLLIQQHLPALAHGAGGAELRCLASVFLPVGELRLDLLHRRPAAVAEPRRELFGTLFAEIAIL